MTATWPIRLTSSCARSSSIGTNSTGAGRPRCPRCSPGRPAAASPTSPRRAAIDAASVTSMRERLQPGLAPAAPRPRACARRRSTSKPQLAQVRRRPPQPMPVEAPVTTTVPLAMAAARYLSASVGPMELEEAIRSRRTHKAYAPEPVDRETLDELLELARWAPNHNLTNPWRFRVLGPEALARLKEAAGPEAAGEARPRAHAGVRLGGAERRPGAGRGGPLRHAPARSTSCCWPRTRAGWPATGARPAVLRTPEGARRSGWARTSTFVGLIHLGHAAAGEGAARAAARPPTS